MERFIDIKELAAATSIPKSTLYKLTHTRQIPFLKIGKSVRFRETDVEKWLQGKSISPQDPRPAKPKEETPKKARPRGARNTYVDSIVSRAKRDVLGD